MSWRPGSAGIEPGQLKTGSCTTKMFDQKRAKSLVHTHISSSPGTTNHPSPPLLLLLLSVVVVVVVVLLLLLTSVGAWQPLRQQQQSKLATIHRALVVVDLAIEDRSTIDRADLAISRSTTNA